jgi:hypothetical protein
VTSAARTSARRALTGAQLLVVRGVSTPSIGSSQMIKETQ